MPQAPASSAAAASPGCSMLASSSTASPSSVTAGRWRSRASPARLASRSRLMARYSSITDGGGSTITVPASPSMTSQSSWRISRLASRAPTTAGMSMLRATIAVCEVLPPTSVTKPRKTPPFHCSMSAGEMSLATSTSGSPPLAGATIGEAPSSPRASTPSRRSTTCSRSALRSRRYSSSISSNCRASTSSCADSAHSAL